MATNTNKETLAEMIASIRVAGFKPRLTTDRADAELARLAEQAWEQVTPVKRRRRRRKPSK